ncbi:class I SAM-dependent methyltransferase [Paeniglutamicibacter cryotolerans]|uniref:SAM-dependent methyltransferase n=1 Tax=Paeniglutamicibacter cryotolerans TaxID=670079 RepID=A0A839QNG8_9MICC|nr:class I SAM-dependent methyltransferase [Paeniglutamicibacter cryotolerans]MBB2994762.1 SAM-dependent methyltransferase [Paeniglutamicibacter cryotolerans]
MGLYAEQILPRLINVGCGPRATGRLRARVCAPLRGAVLELGFGSGANVPFYPPTLASVSAVDPSGTAWELAARRRDKSAIPIHRAGLDGQLLDSPDDSFDTALSTWTLCTIPDPVRALAEVRRVLKPGGFLRFVEHGLAPEESVRRWQRRIEPLQRRLVGGCHLTRDIEALLQESGFEPAELECFYEPGMPRSQGCFYLGTAVPR